MREGGKRRRVGGVWLNDRERAYAIDVNGKTVTFFTSEPGDLLAADQPELQQVLDSIEFEPTADEPARHAGHHCPHSPSLVRAAQNHST